MLWNTMIEAGDPGIEILHAYTVKENLRQLLALSGTNPDRDQIRARLWDFYTQASSSDIPEVHRLAATIETWWPAVEAGITTGYSKARSEGYNRLAKHQGRNAFGSATSRTTPGAYAGRALVNTSEPRLRSARGPVKFDEPATAATSASSATSPALGRPPLLTPPLLQGP